MPTTMGLLLMFPPPLQLPDAIAWIRSSSLTAGLMGDFASGIEFVSLRRFWTPLALFCESDAAVPFPWNSLLNPNESPPSSSFSSSFTVMAVGAPSSSLKFVWVPTTARPLLLELLSLVAKNWDSFFFPPPPPPSPTPPQLAERFDDDALRGRTRSGSFSSSSSSSSSLRPSAADDADDADVDALAPATLFWAGNAVVIMEAELSCLATGARAVPTTKSSMGIPRQVISFRQLWYLVASTLLSSMTSPR